MPDLSRARRALQIAVASAAVSLAWNSAVAAPLNVSQTFSRTLVSSKRAIEPLIDYTVFPWPYAYYHGLERVDRFTNTSFDTTVTITHVAALVLDPETLGYPDLTPANSVAAEQTAALAHPSASFWAVEDLPFAAYLADWTTGSVFAQSEAGASLALPLTLAPLQSVLLRSSAFNVGTIESMAEMVIGWEFEGSQSQTSPPAAGDVNRDGRVDLNDFGVLKANLGATNAVWSQGDLDRDGQVTLSDFGLLKKSLNASVASVAPEPSAGLLALCAGWLFALRPALRKLLIGGRTSIISR